MVIPIDQDYSKSWLKKLLYAVGICVWSDA